MFNVGGSAARAWTGGVIPMLKETALELTLLRTSFDSFSRPGGLTDLAPAVTTNHRDTSTAKTAFREKIRRAEVVNIHTPFRVTGGCRVRVAACTIEVSPFPVGPPTIGMLETSEPLPGASVGTVGE